MNLSEEYPAWAAFIESQNEKTPCALKLEKARAARGKKKARRAEPACYTACVGAECRRTLSALESTTDAAR